MDLMLEKRFSKDICDCIEHLESRVSKNEFTAWSFAKRDTMVSAFFADEYDINSLKCEEDGKIDPHPLFDLASLTKPLFLNLLFFIEQTSPHAWQQFLSTPLESLISERPHPYPFLNAFLRNHKNLTLDHFLSHRSGLKAWTWMGKGLWKKQKEGPFHSQQDAKAIHFSEQFLFDTFEEIICKQYDPHLKENYSDLNYFVLARIFEILYKEKEERYRDFWSQKIDIINNLLQSHFFHASLSPEKTTFCIPYYPYLSCYEDATLSSTHTPASFGPVSDTNGNIFASLGSKDVPIVSGHTGFFGSVRDISQYIQFLLEKKIFTEQSLREYRFSKGFDTVNAPQSLAGIRNVPFLVHHLFGHLGYSGTSFWMTQSNMNPVQYSILLTNRTAQRLSYGTDVPRLYVISQNGKHHIFCQKKGKIEEILWEEYADILRDYRSTRMILWNQTPIPSIPDISLTRKYVGEKMWSSAHEKI